MVIKCNILQFISASDKNICYLKPDYLEIP